MLHVRTMAKFNYWHQSGDGSPVASGGSGSAFQLSRSPSGRGSLLEEFLNRFGKFAAEPLE